MPQTPAERKADERARIALLGLTEVRGIYLPPALHKEIKEAARKLLKKHTAKEAR